MKRKDAEKAVKELDGLDWGGSVLRVGWSKPVPMPQRALYGASRPQPTTDIQTLPQSLALVEKDLLHPVRRVLLHCANDRDLSLDHPVHDADPRLTRRAHQPHRRRRSSVRETSGSQQSRRTKRSSFKPSQTKCGNMAKASKTFCEKGKKRIQNSNSCSTRR